MIMREEGSTVNIEELLPLDVFVKILEYLDLLSVFNFSLCNKETNHLVNTTEHIWRVIYHQLWGEYQEELADDSDPKMWKQRVREALKWAFEPCESDKQPYELSNRNTTLHNRSENWITVCFGKQFTLKEHCGKTICYEIVLDQFNPNSVNYFAVIIGGHWHESRSLSCVLAYSSPYEVGFSCGNQFVFQEAKHMPTEEAVGLRAHPKEMIGSGDVIGVKLMIEQSGECFDIQFFLNGVKREVRERLVEEKIYAKIFQPCLSIVHPCVLSIKNP